MALIGMIMATLAGCGGGGSSDPDGGGDVTAPTIVDQPDSVSVAVGENATFTVSATGDELTYQWQKLNTTSASYENISGATSNSYSITSAETTDAGTFRVVVSNSAGTATSSAATLTVSSDTGGGTVIVD